MRKPLVLLVALAVAGLVAYLVHATFQQEPQSHRSGAAPRTEQDTEEREPPAPGALLVEEGVARAPDFKDVEAGPGRRVWYGQALMPEGSGAAEAHVLVETVNGERAWAQPATREGGFFLAIVDDELMTPARIVVTAASGEVGMKAVRVADEAVHVGKIRLRGAHELAGRTMFSQDDPAPHVSLSLHQFGELSLGVNPVAATASDEEGYFTFKRVPQGMFLLRGEAPTGRRFLAVPVIVPREGITLYPIRATDYVFFVRNTLNEPVSDAFVTVSPVGPPPEKDPFGAVATLASVTATSDTHGRGVVRQLPAGEYEITVTVKQATFRFRRIQTQKPNRFVRAEILRVPTDRTIALQFIEAPEEGKPATIRPLRKTSIEVKLTGGGYDVTKSVKTNDEGIAFLPRVAQQSLRIEAVAKKIHRRGSEFIHLGFSNEGPIPLPVFMRLYDAPAKRARTKRRDRVVSADGTPVRNARLYLAWDGKAKRKRRTDKEGEADLGDAPDRADVCLFRPDLASGDPNVGPVGGAEIVELVWKRGRALQLTVRDHQSGIPLGSGVVVNPRPKAWKKTGPGTFATYWDDDWAPEGELSVWAPGYGTYKTAIGEASEYVAEMVPAGAHLARLRIEARQDNLPRPGVWVSGYTLYVPHPKATHAAGRATFTALTGAGGRVEIGNLAPGAWFIQVDAGSKGGRHYEVTLAAGLNPLNVEYDRKNSVRGRVKSRRGRGIAGATIVPADKMVRMPAVRSDGAGYFWLNFAKLNGQKYGFKATAPGYGSASFTVAARRTKKTVSVVLQPDGAVEFTLRWTDGRSRALPTDIEMAIFVVEEGGIRNNYERIGTARVVGGRLRAYHLPAGRKLSFWQLRGSAWIKNFTTTITPGRTTRRYLAVHAGGIVEGKAVRDGKPARNVVLFLHKHKAGTRPVRTDDEGNFTIGGLHDGLYRIRSREQTKASAMRNEKLFVEARRALTGILVELR